MGQGVSKRQSYTPGETKDAGLPTPPPADQNGDVKTGANRLVELLSNKTHHDDITRTSSAPVTPSSATSPTDKKKRKTPRFVFSLKRTGSGKRSRKPKKEANGVRPMSYPAPKSGDHANKDGHRPQSLFLEEIAIPEDDGKIETVSLSSTDEHKEKSKKKDSDKPSSPKSPKPSSSSSKPSSPKGKKEKEKKKDGSQKKKDSKKKRDKDAKARAEKQKKEAEKEKDKKEEEEDKAEKTEVVEEVAQAEQAAALPGPSAEAKPDEVGAEAKSEVNTEAKREDAVVEAKDEEPKPEEAAESDAVKTVEAASGEGTSEETEASLLAPKEPVEVVVEVAVATVSHSAVSVIKPSDEQAEAQIEQPEITVQQTAAVLELIITNDDDDTEAAVDQAKEPEEKKDDMSEEKTEEATEVPSVTKAEEEEQERAKEDKPTIDVTQLVSVTITPPEEPTVDKTEAPEVQAEVPEAAANTDTPKADVSFSDINVEVETEKTTEVQAIFAVPSLNTEAVEDKVEAAKDICRETTVVEVEPTPQSVQPEAVEETIQQKVEALVEAAPFLDVTESKKENKEETEEPAEAAEAVKSEESEKIEEEKVNIQQIAENAASSAADVAVAVAFPEAAASVNPAQEDEKKPEEQAPPPMSPAQLKAVEKERKAAKKREEKEKAKKEKEDKKRLKEQQKREAKEKKQREKEEKERSLREAKEKVKAAANMTLTVKAPEPLVVEETLGATQTQVAEAAPSTSAEEPNIDAQLNVNADIQELSASEESTDGGLLGCSVKDIISSIENSVNKETAAAAEVTVDDSKPPAVPEAPYPDEDVARASTTSQQCSSPTSSSAASSPISPFGPNSPISDDPQSPVGDSVPGSPISPETGETARSGVLRKIELGPRLRTAILRKSSSGAESDEKRVSLTQPRHVQVSDLTPPPRKQRPRRPLEQAWSPLGGYTAGSPRSPTSPSSTTPQSPASPPKDKSPAASTDIVPEPVVEGQMTVASASSIQSAPPTSSSAEESPEKETTTAGEDSQQGSSTDTEYKVMADLPSSGSRASLHADPESTTVVSVATIVLGGVAEVSDAFPFVDSPHTIPEDDEEGEKTEEVKFQVNGELESPPNEADYPPDKAESPKSKPESPPSEAESPVEAGSTPNEAFLQELAREVVTRVQQAAQLEAAAIVAAEKDENDVKCANSEDTVQDSDNEDVEEVHASVVCSAELVKEATDSCVSDSVPSEHVVVADEQTESSNTDITEALPESSEVSVSDSLNSESDSPSLQQPESLAQISQAATEPSTSQSDASAPQEDCQNSEQNGSVEVKSETVSEKEREEKEADFTDKEAEASTPGSASEAKTEEGEADTLQQFNQNYYDIAAVADDDVDDDDASEVLKAKDNQENDKTVHVEENSSEVSSPSNENSSPKEHDDKIPNGKVPEENGGGSCEEEEEEKEKEEKSQEKEGEKRGSEVTMIARCNGSHDTIDAYLKLQAGLIEGKKAVVDTLEANNNISEDKKESPDQAERTTSLGTNDNIG
ncbi:microtubule-associated protein futsch-like [Littorina saxatilis]|uniref:microtubule-associated protein futsch-like n=1 Tax=Littorina saxatilis TaxID=31220 RepID=UPI0038B569F4